MFGEEVTGWWWVGGGGVVASNMWRARGLNSP